jgi:hypothetical protein
MKKKTITLATLLRLMKYLEKDISLKQKFIIDNNHVLKPKEDKTVEEKVRSYYDIRQKEIKQFQTFKIAKDAANAVESNGVTNNERIYERSDLVKDERFITSLHERTLKTKKGGKDEQYHFYIPKSKLTDELQRIEERLNTLSDQMSEFNESFEVEVDLDESLNLV